ncbi:Hypothetical predicted protein [Mytilus galloprovincialis]|uniref:Uncharacterized protein n=1 Tax=Mytilus galloprovincialis TaxID=29158 RepID=A0A8B6E7V7_MYTGA|nr:Hypothetical predicted protein [Mytilus galloprovincialis]
MSPATCYVTSNLVVAVMHFFGMETENDNPVRNCPSAQESSYDLMGKFVDKYIFPVWSGENDQCTDLKGDVCDDQNDMGSCQTVKVTLANGMVLEIPMTTPAHAKIKKINLTRSKIMHIMV